jgi:hypothetical protein
MKRKMLLVAACAAALWSAAAMAVPTVDEVAAADRAGDYPKAESMVREVIAAKPQSARAHYILAEILSKEHKFADASAEARQAREIDPSLKFTDPQKFRTFESELAREQAAPAAPVQVAPTRMNTAPAAPVAPVQAAGGGIPGWVWVGGIVLILFLVFRSVSRRAMASNLAANGGYAPQGGYGMQPGMPQPGYGPGYGPGYAPAPGGGLLRTGLAAAGGVAGGMLLERMLEGDRRDENPGNNIGYGSQGANWTDADQATRDLDNRPIDYGTGGSDWGGDSSGGGSDNFTPSGGGDDGGGW